MVRYGIVTGIIKSSVVKVHITVPDATEGRYTQVWEPLEKVVKKNVREVDFNSRICLPETPNCCINWKLIPYQIKNFVRMYSKYEKESKKWTGLGLIKSLCSRCHRFIIHFVKRIKHLSTWTKCGRYYN